MLQAGYLPSMPSGWGSQVWGTDPWGGSTSDAAAPVFAGIVSAIAISLGSIVLTWNAATDNITAQNQIVYYVYKAKSDGTFDYTTPYATTAAGATTYTDNFALAANTVYTYSVRARDLVGNIDTNTITASASFSVAVIDKGRYRKTYSHFRQRPVFSATATVDNARYAKTYSANRQQPKRFAP